MKSFPLLAITALMMSGAAMAQTQGPSATSSSTMSTDGSQPNTTAAPATATPTGPVSNVTSQGTSSTATQSPQSSTYGTTPSTTSSTSTTSPSSMSSTSPSSTSSASSSSSTASSTQSPTMVEQKVDLTTEPGPPADKRAARTEAVNALAWMKSEGCRSDPSPRDCVRKAQDDYKATMARLGSGPTDSGSSVSASGTSQAGERAARSDRN